MPTNRTRRTRGHRDIDELRLLELRDGPGACLLAGCGYSLEPTGRWGVKSPTGECASFEAASPAGRAVILGAMRDDWQRVGAQLIAEHDDPQAIWAFREFGEPK